MNERIDETISVKVLFFGAARDAAGAGEIMIDTTAPANVDSVKKAVFSRYVKLEPFAQSLMIAVNQEYAAGDAVVDHLDVVAFLPPVSGG